MGVKIDQFYSECTLCPRNCGVDRRLHTGYCGCHDTVKAARAGLHYYEEPFISGTNGSGTVFFTGCSLGCIYCQNAQISQDHIGFDISVNRLVQIFLEQQERKAHNINLVTGTHFTPTIALALKEAKNMGLHIPVVWNSSGYEKPETLALLDGLVDIFMPDFKTLSPELGLRYFHAPDYPDRAKEALACMVRMTGKAVFEPLPAPDPLQKECRPGEAIRNNNDTDLSGGEGRLMKQDTSEAEIREKESEYPGESVLMKRGVVVRHLVIPGQTEDSMNVLRYLYDTYGDDIWISLMNQYTPVGRFAGKGSSGGSAVYEGTAIFEGTGISESTVISEGTIIPEGRRVSESAAGYDRYPELFRTVSADEYDRVVDLAIDLGVENCMIQDQETADDSFIPLFDGTGILPV